ncbi:MAG: AbrB/MazE/SpoVT family DNA-binding domain-containing protein [Chloroflexota bacterium]
MVSQVSERGQITIDRNAREQLGVRPGMIAYQRVVAGHLEVVFLPAPHRRSLYGALREDGEQVRVETAEELEDAVMEAVSDEQARKGDDSA